MKTCDLLVVGAGPAGLSAAINAASEGLKVALVESGEILGGQAKQSYEIANYPGFPEGVTGGELLRRMVEQCSRFGVEIIAPHRAGNIVRQCRRDITTGDTRNTFTVTTDDYEEIEAKSVVLALGLTYRKHQAKGVADLLGHGVFYGIPTRNGYRNIVIVGGANSAGQAVLRYAANPKNKVTVVIRKKLTDQMSKYLVDQVKGYDNVTILEGYELVEAVAEGTNGHSKLAAVNVSRVGENENIGIEADALLLFIGGMPQTRWLQDTVELSPNKFVLTTPDVSGVSPLPFQTSVPGIFAVGDAREGSNKRMASAIGEGSAVVQSVHRYLDALKIG